MTNEQPLKVSVIIPSYNMAKYLPPTLDSILSQDYPSFEVLVVDDASTDDTAAVVAQYVTRYPDQVKYILRPNGGESAARNTGIRAATGEALMFVDGDDLLVEHSMSTLANQLAKLGDDYCLVHGEMENFDDVTGENLGYTNFHIVSQNRKRLFTDMTNLMLSGIVRKAAMEKIGLFAEEVKDGVITDTLMKLCKLGKFYSVQRVVYKYRIRPHSRSRTFSHERALLLTEQGRQRLTTLLPGESPITQIAAWAAYYLKAGIDLHQYERDRSRRFFLLAMLLNPFNLLPLKLLRASLANKLP